MATEKNKNLLRAKDAIEVARFLHYRDYLGALYNYMKDEIKNYSYLKFAEDLGFGANNNAIRLVITGHRPLTLKAAQKIIQAIDLKSFRRKFFECLVEFNTTKTPAKRDETFRRLMVIKTKLLPHTIDEARLEYFNEWYHPIIREMATRNDFEMEAKWVQDHIGFPLRLEEIKKSLTLLSKLGLIYYDATKNRYMRSDEFIDTGADARGIAFIRYHQKMMDLGKQAITKVRKDKREFEATTLTINQEGISQIQAKIRTLIDEAMTLEANDGDPKNPVIQLNIQLFSCTKDKKS